MGGFKAKVAVVESPSDTERVMYLALHSSHSDTGSVRSTSVSHTLPDHVAMVTLSTDHWPTQSFS